MLTTAALAPRNADDPGLDVTPDDILIVCNVGPRGYPGMLEGGNAAS